MAREKNYSGVETSFKDKDGEPIRVHSYVKDDEGNMYFINSHAQAVPDGGDAPAIELSRLIETTGLTVMSSEEVLGMSRPEVKRRRGGRKAQKEEPAPAGEAVQTKEPLFPVSMELLLTAVPDNELANELRRRGYTICAVKPALLQI